jgi:outer membrane protein assembly factor BamB
MHWLRSILLLPVLAPLAMAADWPQWLGPQRDNSTTEIVAPWQEAPKVLWRQPVGEGNSSPTVAGGRVFIHAKVADKTEEEVIAYDSDTGKEKWRTPYKRAAFASLYGNGPRATPAVFDGKVYTFGITGVASCLDAASGRMVWQVDTLERFKAKNLFFGMACSPLVDKDHVYLNVGAEKASIVALNRNTGEVAWQSLDDKASYSSPIAFRLPNGPRQLVFLTAKGLTSLGPDSGKLYWQFPLVDKLLESSTTPVKVGERIIASSITYGTACLSLTTKDDSPGYKEEWKNPELTSYFSTPIAVGTGYLYMVTGKNPTAFKGGASATLHCVDMKNGKTLWKKEKVGTYHAALMRTGDNKLLMLQDSGDLALLEPNPEEYKEICRAHVCGFTWAHPVLVNGKLYLRDDKNVLCVQLGK